MQRILVMTAADDRPARDVSARLQARGADVIEFDPYDLLAGTVTITHPVRGDAWRLRHAGRTMNLRTLESIWMRRPRLPAIPVPESDQLAHTIAAENTRELLFGILETLPCRFFPARPAATRRASYKLLQLELAKAVGFATPPTLITTDPEVAVDFYRRHGGSVVSKMLAPIPDGHSRFTEPVTMRDMAYIRRVRNCPVLMQAYVAKRHELRVTVVGESVFAARIDSQVTNHTRHDWRRYDHGRTPIRIERLTNGEADKCRKLVQQLGLCFGAIDLVVTPNGECVFLEVNPSGQWSWIEGATGLEITEAICDVLLYGASESRRNDQPISGLPH